MLHSLLHRAEVTQQGRNSCPRLQFGFQFELYRVVAPLSFLRGISLASLFTSHVNAASRKNLEIHQAITKLKTHLEQKFT